MDLIIAEKPSLARNIVTAIGNMTRKDGYYYSDKYIVTWAFGHLFRLYDIEEYMNKEGTKWSMNDLPYFPQKFKFQLKEDEGIKKQFSIIEKLCNDPKVNNVINAGDADREGEIIVRLCIEHALSEKKPLKRLWLKDQTEKTIKAGLEEVEDEQKYHNLANEGLARTYIDWLYGVNLTRFASLKCGLLLRVGRVIVPIVKAIYDRDMTIKNFQAEKYYSLCSSEKTNNEIVELLSTKKFKYEELNQALEVCKKNNEERAYVADKKIKKEVINAGKLYSLTKLQNALSKKYKMTMEESLTIVQGLYEKGYVTYPRTNSEYLAVAEKDKIKGLISIIRKLGYGITFKDKKTIFDDSKIESHSALTPTYIIPKKNDLSEREFLVYQTIFKRFVAVFCEEECLVNRTEIKINVGQLETFSLKGMVMLTLGWTKYDDRNGNDKLLPNLEINDTININFKPKEKETTPPKHYTIETLNNYLKNPFREDKNNDDDTDDYKAIFEGLELGTEATRTGIIGNAIKSEYIELKKDVYYLLDNGKYLIESLKQMSISMDKYKTSQLGQALKKVYHADITIDQAILLAQEEIADVFKEKEDNTGFFGDYVGVCPVCGNKVVKGRYGYGCMGYKEGCTFKISSVICQKNISIQNAKELLMKGKTSKIKGFISKNNKPFEACLRFEGKQVVFDFS